MKWVVLKSAWNGESEKKGGGFINKEVVLTCGVLIDTLKCGKAHGSGVNCHLRGKFVTPRSPEEGA